MKYAIGAALAAVTLAGCDDLTLPQRPITQAATTDGGGTTINATDNGMIPAGAATATGTFGGHAGMYTWVTQKPDGSMNEFGFNIPLDLVQAGGNFDVDGMLPLPQPMLDKTQFKAFSLVYLPHGHAPAGVYDIPHWEWHLYVIDEAAVADVTCVDTTVPPKAELPPNHFVLPACLPRYGMHAYDLAAPEFNGQKFTEGTYGGYYHGNFIAVEPKISVAQLLLRQSTTLNGFNPAPLGPAGIYPAKFNVTTSDTDVIFRVTEWVTK